MEHRINSGECPRINSRQDLSTCGSPLKTPIYLTGVMVSVMRQYFGSSERISIETATFLWDRDQSKSEIYISDEFNWDLENVGVRPALIVGLGSFSALEAIPTLGRSGLVGYNSETGRFSFGGVGRGSFEIQCVAKQKLECWSLAWEVKMMLQSYATVIQDIYGLRGLDVAGVSKPQKIQEADGYMSAAVTVNFNMVDAWSLRMENLRVQSIDTRVILDTKDPAKHR